MAASSGGGSGVGAYGASAGYGQGGGYSLGSGYYGRFLKIRNSTKYVQNGLDNISRTFERVKNLLNWAHPSKTHAVLVVMLLLSLLVLPVLLPAAVAPGPSACDATQLASSVSPAVRASISRV